jgi:hypothetical protein
LRKPADGFKHVFSAVDYHWGNQRFIERKRQARELNAEITEFIGRRAMSLKSPDLAFCISPKFRNPHLEDNDVERVVYSRRFSLRRRE